jgi:hypothetical protein
LRHKAQDRPIDRSLLCQTRIKKGKGGGRVFVSMCL